MECFYSFINSFLTHSGVAIHSIVIDTITFHNITGVYIFSLISTFPPPPPGKKLSTTFERFLKLLHR